MAALKYWLWLTTRKGLGNQGVTQVLERFGSPEQAYFADPGEYDFLQPNVATALRDRSMDAVERIIEGRSLYTWSPDTDRLPLSSDATGHYIRCAMPILSEGDLVGCVVSMQENNDSPESHAPLNDVEIKLIQTAAGFLGRQLES